MNKAIPGKRWKESKACKARCDQPVGRELIQSQSSEVVRSDVRLLIYFGFTLSVLVIFGSTQ